MYAVPAAPSMLPRLACLLVVLACAAADAAVGTTTGAPSAVHHALLQASVVKSELKMQDLGEPVLREADPLPSACDGSCDEGCSCEPPHSLRTEGSSRVQRKTVVKKVVFDLVEDDE
mmetsp:Transcript_117336/g.373849  ORF Transcript_117336/g.373849 Transcript_117336/m.373849 type:complete len:117 (+) Transcript_117336:71-421(+)